MIWVGLRNYSRDSSGVDTISFNTFTMGAAITILPIYSGLERLTESPEATYLESGELRI